MRWLFSDRHDRGQLLQQADLLWRQNYKMYDLIGIFLIPSSNHVSARRIWRDWLKNLVVSLDVDVKTRSLFQIVF